MGYSNQQIIQWYNAVCSLLNNSDNRPVQYNYALLRNRMRLEPLVMAYTDTLNKISNSPQYAELQKMWQEKVLPNFLVDGKFDQSRNAEFSAACLILAASNPEWQRAVQEREMEIRNLQQMPVEFSPYQINYSALPPTISGIEIQQIGFMLKIDDDIPRELN